MLQLMLFGLAKALQRFVVWFVAFPILLVLATPVIFIRAGILAWRKRQSFGHAVADGYGFLSSLWTPLGYSRAV